MRKFFLLPLVAVAACSATPSLLEPPPKGQGVQYRMLTKVAAGAEVEHCQFFVVPPEGLNVSRTETRFTAGSHHVLMYATQYSTIPTKNDRGEAVDTSGVFDCTSGANDGWSITNMVGGSQNGDGDSPVFFPPGVAMTLQPGAVMMMNSHYINATLAPIEPEIRMNFHTVPKTASQIEGGILFWYDIFIRVDARGRGQSTMNCTVPEDIKLVRAQSHMHRRGVGFTAEAQLAGGEKLALYETDHWERVPTKEWPGGLAVAGGTRIQFSCNYSNEEDRVVWQGPRSRDEMCVFAASYYPAKQHISFCSLDPAAPLGTSFIGGNWVGNGTTTCADTLVCMQGIDRNNFFEGLTSCVLASAPAESERVSNVVRCIFTKDDPLNECTPEFSACINP